MKLYLAFYRKNIYLITVYLAKIPAQEITTEEELGRQLFNIMQHLSEGNIIKIPTNKE